MAEKSDDAIRTACILKLRQLFVIIRRNERLHAQLLCHCDERRELVEFLVESHLAMPHVAQKQDVYDPEVIAAFAKRVQTERRLIALYLLTVADLASRPIGMFGGRQCGRKLRR